MEWDCSAAEQPASSDLLLVAVVLAEAKAFTVGLLPSYQSTPTLPVTFQGNAVGA